MRIHYLFIGLCCLFSLFAQADDTKTVTAKIEEVKIHLQGAEVIRSHDMTLTGGKHKIVFTNLSPKINAQSVQITASGGSNILSITNKINFLRPQDVSPRVKRIQDSLALVQINQQALTDLMDAYNWEAKVLDVNKNLTGKEKGLPVSELVQAADFYRKRMLEINTKRSEIRRDATKTKLLIQQLQRQLNELNARNQPTSEIYLVVKVPSTSTVKLRLRYIVRDAGWSPIYDLNAGKLNEPIHLKYRALAYNNTGIDWNDVKIALSTADPNQSASEPRLTPWILNYNAPSFTTAQQGYLNSSNVLQNNNDYRGNVAGELDFKPGSNNPNIRMEAIEVSEMNTDFEVKDKYTIPSDFQPYSINIIEHDLTASYKHYVVPKLDRDAFLLAQITGWEDLDLISGPMNVYHGNSFIGMANLNPRSLNDTLNLSLGRDKKVLVTRVKLAEMSKKQFLGGNKKVSFAYKISVKNNHAQSIEIEILDQLPLSRQKDIVVTADEISKAKHYPATGKLKWLYKLNSSEKKSVTIGYSIKYPKNKEVQFQKQRKAYAPRYF